jgi:hypothetical protein
MKKAFLFALIIMMPGQLFADKILYAEQFYKLYHEHFYHYPEDTAEAIFYLGMALRSDFCNPLYALATIEDETEWEKYRYLFFMHVNLKLVNSYLTMASKYDKFKAYFYNAPWKEDNLESLEIAESYYNLARQFWRDAVVWAEKASDPKLRWITLEEIQYWDDERFRIEAGELDYDRIIDRQLKRLSEVRASFEAMDENTY